MAEITLREFTDQIRETLRAGRPTEAVEMCRHVLHHYPRHIASYVLLGQALLEQRDYEQAGEILTLALSADPENVVAYVSLSKLHEAQHMLDEAIWDMERAFELNPNNVAIREELMRLRGLRDGIGRYRIKLTTGALGRLYAQGDLHSRAIQEFEAVLRQEPARLDMQLALAESLWRDRRPGDAVDLCQQILARAPNCLKATLLLGKIWQEMGMADEGHRLLQLAQNLDPDNEMAQDMFEDQSPLPPRRVTIPQPRPAAPPIPAWTPPPPPEVQLPVPTPLDMTIPDWMRAELVFGEALAEESPAEESPTPPPVAPPVEAMQAPAPVEQPAPTPTVVKPAVDWMTIPDWMKAAIGEMGLEQPTPPVEERPAPVAPRPPVEERAAPVAPRPPVEERAAPVAPRPPVEERAAPVAPRPPVEERAAPVAPRPPVEERAAPVAPRPPVEERAAPVAPPPEPAPAGEEESVKVISAFLRPEEFRQRLEHLLSEAGVKEGELPVDDLYLQARAELAEEIRPAEPPVESPLGVAWSQPETFEPGEMPPWLDESIPIEEAMKALRGPGPEPEPEPVPTEPAWTPPPWLTGEWKPPAAEPAAPAPPTGEPGWTPPSWLAETPAAEPAAPAPPTAELIPAEEKATAPLEKPIPAPVTPLAREQFEPLEPAILTARARLAPDALQNYVESLLVEPNDYYARLIVASAYQEAGKYDLALEHYEIIIQSAPSLPEQVVTNLEDMVRRLPGSEPAHRLLGDAYLKQGRYDEATVQYNLALELQ